MNSNGQNDVLISIVSPVYRAEFIIDELVARLRENLMNITDKYEIILVEDGSPDNSWTKIKENCARDKNIRGFKLSKNFGQHYAITAGLDQSNGEWVVVMDCDLQDNPAEIANLYGEAKKGYDIVFAKRVARQDNPVKIAFSKIFYKVFSYLSGVTQDGTISNFGIYHRKTINAMNSMREPMRAFSPMARFVGFRKSYIDVVHGARFQGASSYNWSKLINLALDISVSYSDKPLKLAINLGFLISLITMAVGVYLLSQLLFGRIQISNSIMLLLSIWFLGGLIIFIIGIVGIYVGKIFDGVKARPLYFIEETATHE